MVYVIHKNQSSDFRSKHAPQIISQHPLEDRCLHNYFCQNYNKPFPFASMVVLIVYNFVFIQTQRNWRCLIEMFYVPLARLNGLGFNCDSEQTYVFVR